MMDSVRLFFRNLIKYFLYIAVFAQIVSGTVYLVCHFLDFIVYPETEEMVHAARGLLFDEYIGFLYPLFIRLCLGIQQFLGIGYYLVAHTVQLILFILAAGYMVKPFFSRKKGLIATAFVVTNPMCIQTILMVSPFAFKAVFGFVIVGAMVRIGKEKWNIKAWGALFAAYALAAFNVPDDLYVWLIPIAIFSLVIIFKKHNKEKIYKKICLFLAVIVVFFGTFGVLNGVVEEGSRGRMQKTVSSVLFQRTLWPELRIKFGFLPMDIRYHIDPDAALSSDSSAETILYEIGPRVDREVGLERANELYMESVLNQLEYNKRAIFDAVVSDFTGYLLTPYSVITYMTGQEGSAFGSLYSLMSAQSPLFTYNYFCISFVAMFLLTFAALLKYVKEKAALRKNFTKVVLFFVGILIYQALWYAIVNVQGVDYRYVLLNVAVFAIFALSSILDKKEEKTPEKSAWKISKRKIFIGGSVVLGLLAIVIVVAFLGKGYKESDMLKDKKIVCFGDSIWGLVTDDTGIAAYVEEMTGATVSNFALSGTTASETMGTEIEDNFSPFSLIQIVEAIENSGENTDKALSAITDETLADADYLIIAYGLNDYFNGISVQAEDTEDVHTYEGALRYAVRFFKERYPDLQIVLIGQTYCQFYSYGIVEEDSDTRNLGGGVGTDYVEAVRGVAEEYDLIFINQYEELPIGEWNGKLFLEDATHLNQKGRLEYAKVVSKYLLEDFEERKAQ